MKIVLASNNAGKLAELQTMFAPLNMTLVRQSELNIPEAEEPFRTFVENALAKARHAAQLSGLPALADDAGLCVDAFGGQPGVDTAYYATRFGYAKSDDNNVTALLEQAYQPSMGKVLVEPSLDKIADEVAKRSGIPLVIVQEVVNNQIKPSFKNLIDTIDTAAGLK